MNVPTEGFTLFLFFFLIHTRFFQQKPFRITVIFKTSKYFCMDLRTSYKFLPRSCTDYLTDLCKIASFPTAVNLFYFCGE